MVMNKGQSLLRQVYILMGRPKNFDKTNKNAELGIAIGNKDYWGKGFGMAPKQHVTNRFFSV